MTTNNPHYPLTLEAQSSQAEPRASSAWLSLLKARGNLLSGRVLILDPGETTGVALFEDGYLLNAGQIVIRENFSKLEEIFLATLPQYVVCEEYRIYGGKAMSHAHSTIPTLRYIGAIQMLCSQRDINIYFQSASRAKGFCTDDRLHDWGMYVEGLQHARDAIRHGAAFYLFNKQSTR
jgi:hypothetical protein